MIRLAEPEDRPRVEAFLDRHGSSRVARLGELLRPIDQQVLIAEDRGLLAGVLTYTLSEEICEVLSIHAAQRWRGTGTELLAELERIAYEAGCARVTLITTNDNVDALRFYQRRGYRLLRLHPGAVDDSRARLKPEIPEMGEYGIPLRDEIELEKPL